MHWFCLFVCTFHLHVIFSYMVYVGLVCFFSVEDHHDDEHDLSASA